MTTVTDDTERMRPSAVTAKDIARAGVTRRARDSRLKIWVGSICALVVILPVAFARVLPLPSPDATDLGARRLSPLTDGHLFGTDQLGRDLLARVLFGGQVSLTIGVLAVVVSGHAYTMPATGGARPAYRLTGRPPHRVLVVLRRVRSVADGVRWSCSGCVQAGALRSLAGVNPICIKL